MITPSYCYSLPRGGQEFWANGITRGVSATRAGGVDTIPGTELLQGVVSAIQSHKHKDTCTVYTTPHQPVQTHTHTHANTELQSSEKWVTY